MTERFDFGRLVVQTISDALEYDKHILPLARLLQHCVNDDPACSSIGFLSPLSEEDAVEYWKTLTPSLNGPRPPITLVIATDKDSNNQLIATVQIGLIPKVTHAHRGEIRKLLIDPQYRSKGLGRYMMDDAERIARQDLKLELLVLDTASQTPAREFYLRTNWREWGICPDYAMYADGRKGECSFFVKMLA